MVRYLLTDLMFTSPKFFLHFLVAVIVNIFINTNICDRDCCLYIILRCCASSVAAFHLPFFPAKRVCSAADFHLNCTSCTGCASYSSFTRLAISDDDLNTQENCLVTRLRWVCMFYFSPFRIIYSA